ncbi:MAG TPA: sulfatase [Myxococcota bacterium]|nr:sulfatase [Myxococcota bacterium]
MRSRALLALVLLLAGCGRPAAPPDVLLITVDTLRPDRLSAYGYARQPTQGIDRLAREGALFVHARADTPWTTPSMASVLTGTYATAHGLKSTSAHRLRDESVTLAELLAAHGYHTAAIVGSFPVDSIYGLDQGFAHYDDTFTKPIWIFPDHEMEHVESEFSEKLEDRAMFTLVKAANDSRRDDTEVTDAALAWLATPPGRPFFLWLHYFGPHGRPDWRVPPEEREKLHLESYDRDLAETDRQIGRLLDALEERGLAANLFVALHADHGESLGEQHYVGHGMLLNEATLRIPLMLRWPGRIDAGVRVSKPVQNVDILPTVLAAAGVSAPSGLAGVNLLPELEAARARAASGATADARAAYMETYYMAHRGFAKPVTLPDGTQAKLGLIRRGVQQGRWKLVRTEAHALFDVAPEDAPAIPEEMARAEFHEELYDLAAGDVFDVLAKHPDVAAQLRPQLDAEIAKEHAADAPTAPLDAEMRTRLEALGYGK